VTAGTITLDAIKIGASEITNTGSRYLVIGSCAPQSAGAMYPKSIRSVTYFNENLALPKDLTAYWEQRFGACPPGADARMFLQLYWVIYSESGGIPDQMYVSSKWTGSVLSAAS